MKFKDNRKWGSRSFLDLLEVNGVRFKYDGEKLTFPSIMDEERASSIWYALTGQKTIGIVA